MRIILIDKSRGGLSRLAAGLVKAGAEVERLREQIPGPDYEIPDDLIGVIVHYGLEQQIPALVSLFGGAGIPIMVWYPATAPQSEIKTWTRTGAIDFLVGIPKADLVVLRLQSYEGSMRTRMPWLREAMLGMFRISRSQTSREDDLTVLATTAGELERVFPGTRCSIVMLSPDKSSARVITQGDQPELLDIPIAVDRYPEIQKMLSTHGPVAIKDVKRSPLMKEVRDVLQFKALKSVLAVPIFYRDEVIGLILIRSAEKTRSFDRVEISLCEMIAQSTAVALRNLRLSREMAEEMRRTREAKQEARKKSDDLARMENIFDHSSDGIVVVSGQGKIKGINVNFTRLSGYEKKDVVGRNLDEIMFPAPGESLSLRRVMRQKEDKSLRLNQVLHTKEEGRKSLAVRLDYLAKGREWLVSMHDLTEEKELEDALRRTKEFLENLIDSSMDAIISADMNGTIILFNKAAEAISGYPAEAVIGKMNIVDFYSAGVARDIMRKLRSEEYGGRGKLESTFISLISAGGDEIPINMSASIIYEQGREVASVGIFQDLRERIRIERELRDAQEKLMESKQKETITALSGAASHELNQPLTSIMGYAELLKRIERNLALEMPAHPAVASLKNATEVITGEAERMAQVVRKIGEVTRFETREYVGGTRIMDLDRARGDQDEDLLLWRAMFQNMKEGVLVLGKDTIIRMANPAAIALSEENPTGKSFTRYAHGVEYSRAMEVFQKALRGESVSLDLEVVVPSGRRLNLAGVAIPIAEKDLILVVYNDVTDKKKIDQTLRDLTALHDQLMKSATLPLVAFDVDGKISFWNRAAEKLLGWEAAEVKGKLPEFLIHKFDPLALADVFRKLRKEGEQSGDLVLHRKSGEKIKIYHVDSVMRDEAGKATGFLTMIFDQSQQRAFERELKEKTEHLAVMIEAAEAVRSGVGMEEVMGGVLSGISRLLPMESCAVSIPDVEEDTVLVLGYNAEKGEVFKNTFRIHDDAPLVRRILFLDQPAIVEDTEFLQENLFSRDVARQVESLKKQGIRSLVNYPLIYREQVLGTLHVMSGRPGQYGKDDIKVLDQASGPLTIALANARMFRQIELHNLELSRRAAWMEALIMGGQGIRLNMRVEEVMDTLLKPYMDAHPHQHLSIWLEDREGKFLKLVSKANLGEIKTGIKFEIKGKLENFKKLARTVEEKPEAADKTALLHGSRRSLVVPLMAPERWLGIIRIESEHDDHFVEEERLDVQILAANMAGALRNLYFYRDLDLAMRFQRGLIEDANALILVLDREGKIELINRALAELVDRPAEQIIGVRYPEFFSRHLELETEEHLRLDPRSELFKKTLKQILAGESLVNLRVTINSASGRQSRAVFNTSTILDRQGGFRGFIAIGQNMTRYQELEKYLLQAEKMATVGQMAAGIAHDLSNPLTGILNSGAMLFRRKELDSKSRQMVERILAEARRIEALGQNLMSYSRPSREEMFPLDLGKTLLDSLSFSHYELSRDRVNVETDIPQGLAPIRGVKDQLQQVFINLITNASHALAEKGGGKISIKVADAEAGMMEVRVSDNGTGIPPENLAKLFDPFFTTKPEGKGTGLGLTIVREIVARHRGKIEVESEPGQGATFIIYLPKWEKKSGP